MDTQVKLSGVLKSVGDRVRQLLPADRFYVALYDVDRVEVSFPLVLPEDEDALWSARKLNTKLLPDRLMCQVEPMAVSGDDAAFCTHIGAQGLTYWPGDDPPKAWLGAPMVVEGQVIGALVVENHRSEDAFGRTGPTMLATIARQTAVAVENARLYTRLERRAKSMQVVNELGRELTSGIRLGEQEILERIHEKASRLMDTANMYIALYDAPMDTARFPLMYVDSEPVEVLARSGGKGRTEWIIHHREPLLIHTGDESRAWYQQEGQQEYIGEPFASWVGVPMLSGDSVLGVIATYHKTQDYVYDEDDQLVLSLMAGQAAVAIENARFYYQLDEKVRERTQQIAAIQDIGMKLTSQLELEQVLHAVVQYADEIMSADFSALFPFNYEQNLFENGILTSSKEVGSLGIPSSNGFTATIAKSQEPVFAENAEQQPGTRPKLRGQKRIESFACVPLVAKGKTVGVLYVNFLEEHLFSEEEREAAQILTNQAAVAIENARLLEQEVRLREKEQQKAMQLAVLYGIGVKLTSQLNLEEVLDLIVDSANEALSADFSTLFLYDSQNDEFRSGVRKGKIEIEPSIPSSSGFSGTLAKEQSPLFVEDAENEPSIKSTFAESKGVKSFSSIPLVIRGDTVGVLHINFLEPHSFFDEEKQVVQMLANQAAVAIENARLYQDLGQKVVELEQAQSAIADAERALVRTSLAADFAHKMNNMAGTIPNWANLIKRKLGPVSEKNEQVIRYLDNIEKEAKRILQEARKLQEPMPEPERVDLAELVGSIIRQIELTIAPSIVVEFRSVSDLPPIRANRAQLTNAILNVVYNAQKAIRDKGKIVVALEQNMKAEPTAIQLAISDTGCGIASDLLDNIFEFGTVYWSDGKGTGYGLWRTRNIIEGLGGSISVESTLAQGSTFTISLPTMTGG